MRNHDSQSDKDFFLDILSDKWYNAFRLGEGLKARRFITRRSCLRFCAGFFRITKTGLTELLMKRYFNILTLAAISIVFCCPDLTKADDPEFGSFDIDATSTPSFDPIPFTGQTMYVWPFAAPDDDLYTGSSSTYDLGELILLNGSVLFNDADQKTGDFGIRILSTALEPQTFGESILTLDLGVDIFDV